MLNLEVIEKVPRRGSRCRASSFMAQKKPRIRRRRAISGACPQKVKRTTEPGDVVSTIRGAELAIVDAVITKALEGSYQHAKFLFDYAGLSHQPTPDDDGPSLAQVLLERLGLYEELPRKEMTSSDDGSPAANVVNGGHRS